MRQAMNDTFNQVKAAVVAKYGEVEAGKFDGQFYLPTAKPLLVRLLSEDAIELRDVNGRVMASHNVEDFMNKLAAFMV